MTNYVSERKRRSKLKRKIEVDRNLLRRSKTYKKCNYLKVQMSNICTHKDM